MKYQLIIDLFRLISLEPFNNQLIYGNYFIVVYMPFLYFIVAATFTLLFTITFKKYSLLMTLEFSKILSILTCLFSLFLIIQPYLSFSIFNLHSYICFAGLFKFTKGICLIQIFIFSFGIIILYLTNDYLLLHKQYFLEINFLILTALLGAACTVACNDFLTFFLSVEIQTIPLFFLISLSTINFKAIDASIKYFILTAISSSILLFGISIWYYVIGITNFDIINSYFIMMNKCTIQLSPHLYLLNKILLPIAAVLIIISIIIKLTAAPFHYWVLDIYNSSLLSSILVFSVVPKIPLSIVLNNLFVNVFNYNMFYNINYNILLIIGLFSIIIGTLGAFLQVKLTNILAFGSISHIGFFIICVLCDKSFSVFTTIVYVFTYSINILLFFSGWLSILFDKIEINYAKLLNNLIKKDLYSCIVLTIALFSFAGLPPTLGFSAKLLVLVGLINNNAILSALIIFLFSLISSVYYLRIIKIMWFGDAVNEEIKTHSEKYNYNIYKKLLNFLLIFIIIVGNFIGYLYMYF